MAETIAKAEFDALEKVVNTLAKSVEALATKVKDLENKKPVSSVSTETETKTPAPAAPKPFKLEGIGTVTLKYAAFDLAGVRVTAEAVQADPVLAADLYAKAPQLFIVKAEK